jgi:hypothetical protein
MSSERYILKARSPVRDGGGGFLTVKRGILLLVLLVLFSLATVVWAAGSYDLSWWTVDGGGGRVTNGSYALSGTIGQPDAGTALTGSGYTLTGGFWGGVGIAGGHHLYLPVIARS